jgi:hypothetical protein
METSVIIEDIGEKIKKSANGSPGGIMTAL